MRYRLRTLLIVLALGPALIAVGWWAWRFEPILLVIYLTAIAWILGLGARWFSTE
jgi:hypothetical protein